MAYIEGVRFDFSETSFRYQEDLIHTFIGGSELHGAKVEGADDHDIYGVYVEPPAVSPLSLSPDEHYVWSTSGTEKRNGPEDVDVILYGLKKFAGLAARGNPSVLHFLFAPCALKNETWALVKEAKSFFLANSHYHKYTGYAAGQMARMVGDRNQKVHRPELVEKYGYDTKFAMHTIRILMEGEELISTGNVTLPVPERDYLIDIRKGKISEKQVIREGNDRIARLTNLGKTSKVLPDHVDMNRLSAFVANIYQEHWKLKEAA